ncbi:MAG TPA: MoaD/ThiS family protein [Leucothrix mucor]|nr:MoaD/ThiS family protein [Leucothrix mucor]
MKIKVNYFASLREEMGCGESILQSDESTLSAAEVWALATGQKIFPNKILIAVNQEYVDLKAKIVDGDDVAFFPPVTGG